MAARDILFDQRARDAVTVARGIELEATMAIVAERPEAGESAGVGFP